MALSPKPAAVAQKSGAKCRCIACCASVSTAPLAP
jgi:hypothetical protein